MSTFMETTLFNVTIPSPVSDKGNVMVISGCRVGLDRQLPYSEFEELTYYNLNMNDYGCGRTDIEISFENSLKNPYVDFWIQCVSIRTDNEVLFKINNNSFVEKLKIKHYTKVTKEGKVAFGAGYYFRNEEEREQLLQCSSFCFEGFVALGKKTNVYGFMCKVDRTENGWVLSEGNTYRIYKHSNIKWLFH